MKGRWTIPSFRSLITIMVGEHRILPINQAPVTWIDILRKSGVDNEVSRLVYDYNNPDNSHSRSNRRHVDQQASRHRETCGS